MKIKLNPEEFFNKMDFQTALAGNTNDVPLKIEVPFNNFVPLDADMSFSFSFDETIADDETADDDDETESTDNALTTTSKKNVILVFACMAIVQFIGML